MQRPAAAAPVGPAAPRPPLYKRDVIEQFLCAQHGVKHPWEFIPFGKRVEAWEVMKPVTLTVENQLNKHTFFPNHPSEPQMVQFPVVHQPDRGTRFLDSAAPPDSIRFLHPGTKQPMPLDMDRVCAYTIVTRHIGSTVPWPVAVRLNFYHQGKEMLENRAEHDRMMEAGGSIRGGYITLSPTGPAGQDVEVSAMPREPFAFRNEFFTATMALVNESNLQNGIVTIPHDVCIQAGLPVFQGRVAPTDEAEELLASMMELSVSETRIKLLETAKKKELKPITNWRAIPIMHVLAWGMHSDEFARERGLRVYPFLFSPPTPVPGAAAPEMQGKVPDDILLYYLIDDVAYYQLLDYFRKDWLGKVDVRPLSSMAFEFVPLQATSKHRAPAQVSGDLMVRSSLSYYVAPKLSAAQVANLAPALCPGFPSCHEWNPFKMPYLAEEDNTEEEKKVQ